MKINFIGLSCFLIENEKGYRILVDPFSNDPKWSLGPVFPERFEGKPFGANIVLMTEPDADHAYAPGDFLFNAPDTKPNSDPFSNLDLKGTVIYEWNGDVNIAWHYNVDGIRLAHFSDNAHLLTDSQLKEIGNPDIIFISPPKADSKNTESLDVVRKNIEALKPKIIFWAHHIAPKDLPEETDSEILRNYFIEYFKNNASSSKLYDGEKSFIELCYILENAFILNNEYQGTVLKESNIEVTPELLEKGKDKPIGILFKSMMAGSTAD